MGNSKTALGSIIALIIAAGTSLLSDDKFVGGVLAVIAAHPRVSFLSVVVSLAVALVHHSPLALPDGK